MEKSISKMISPEMYDELLLAFDMSKAYILEEQLKHYDQRPYYQGMMDYMTWIKSICLEKS